jgi:general secretion pathway protein G
MNSESHLETYPISIMKQDQKESPDTANRKRSAGFTLVEMLIVLAMIGLVAGLVIVNLSGSFESGKINTARNWVNGPGKAAVTTYYLQAGEYPATLDALLSAPPGVTTPVVEKASGLLDPWKKKYQYKGPPGVRNPGSFDLWTTAPDGTEIGNWDPPSGT